MRKDDLTNLNICVRYKKVVQWPIFWIVNGGILGEVGQSFMLHLSTKLVHHNIFLMIGEVGLILERKKKRKGKRKEKKDKEGRREEKRE